MKDEMMKLISLKRIFYAANDCRVNFSRDRYRIPLGSNSSNQIFGDEFREFVEFSNKKLLSEPVQINDFYRDFTHILNGALNCQKTDEDGLQMVTEDEAEATMICAAGLIAQLEIEQG